jgi:hypothetical protein
MICVSCASLCGGDPAVIDERVCVFVRPGACVAAVLAVLDELPVAG